MSSYESVKHYFVDEAGDLTLFDKRGHIIVGNEGVSHCFMLGLVELPDPDFAHKRLEELRQELLTNPYFSSASSMQVKRNKTAVAFHANDDLPEVRYEVMRLLPSFGAKAIIGIRRKQQLAEHYKLIYLRTGKKIGSNALYNVIYDGLVAKIFRDKLHSADKINIVFAHRGKSERHEALRNALDKARRSFEAKHGKRTFPPTTISSTAASKSAGLQVVDYYLWAMQRLYERGQERFFRALESQYRLTMDLDDKRNQPYGE